MWGLAAGHSCPTHAFWLATRAFFTGPAPNPTASTHAKPPPMPSETGLEVKTPVPPANPSIALTLVNDSACNVEGDVLIWSAYVTNTGERAAGT